MTSRSADELQWLFVTDNRHVTFPGPVLSRALKALFASRGKPNEIYNYISMHSALAADQLLAKPHAYSPVGWSSAIRDLDGLYPGAAGFLRESTLARVENHVRRESRAINAETTTLVFNSDLGLARCLYLICRALTPMLVVETGVALGMSSAFILQALSVNRRGTLHSIDLPLPREGSHALTGALVPDELRVRWHLHLGASREVLPKIVSPDSIDVFVHDSLHTYRNMRWEFAIAWPRIRAGGVLVSDDVERNRAFAELLKQEPAYWQTVRQEQKPESLFGIAIRR